MSVNHRISFYLTDSEYEQISKLADDMTILRGIKTSVNDIAKSYVLRVMNQTE